MFKFTVSADTLEELFEAVDSMRDSNRPPSEESPTSTSSEPTQPKTRQTRKKAEAPAPIQPETVVFGAAPEAPVENPFGAAPAPVEAAFNPGAAPAERLAVIKLKELLTTLSAQHGEAQVFAWVIQKAFGLSPSVTKEEFLGKLVHDLPDDALIAAYRQGGGKA
jgi:hypothetical protein